MLQSSPKDKYRSIKDITGIELPNIKSERVKSMSDSEVRQLVLEEHYQLVYMFRVYDKMSIPSIALMLNWSVSRVKRLIASFVFKMMLANQWKPANLCKDTVLMWTPKVEYKPFVEDYASSSMVKSLKRYEKEAGIDKLYKWSSIIKKKKGGIK